jgi:hypothetical protein
MKQRWNAHEALLSEIESRLKYAEEEGILFLLCEVYGLIIMIGKSRKLETENIEKEQLEAVNDISAIVAKELSSQLEKELH